MPVSPTYPGIYIQEAPSSSHTILAAQTNIAVFIGYTHQLKTNPAYYGKAKQIFGFMDYQRMFGGFVRSVAFNALANNQANPDNNAGDMAVAVNQFFLNGGSTAYIVALTNGTLQAAPPATVTLGPLTFTATEVTDEVYTMSVSVKPIVSPPVSPPAGMLADVIITYGPNNGAAGTVTETYRRVTLDPASPNYVLTRIGKVGAPVSALVTCAVAPGSPPPMDFVAGSANFPAFLAGGTDFFAPADFVQVLQEDTSLDKVPLLNLMVIPGVTNSLIVSTAYAFCERKYAFLILDPVITDSADGTLSAYPHMVQDSVAVMDRCKNAALYFPFLKSPDPITGAANNPITGLVNEIPPAPTVAGIFAATDVARGVWKAPAGFQASTNNTTGVVERGQMTDPRQGVLNQISVNCLRDFANVGTVVFGSRTLTADPQWTYVPVRRMALFLEQTFLANLKWVIFEPNAEPLWTAITMSISAFMLGLFKQGAFQGSTPSDAFQVQCGSQTTTQADIDNGIVNILVAFAPLKPAEFVVITIAQLAGQTQTS